MSFSFHRFVLLLRRQFSENTRLYTLGLLALAGFWVIMLGLVLLERGGITGQREVFRIGVLLGSIVLAHHLFQALSNVPGAIRLLHLPASSLEKILTAFFMCMVVYPLAAVAVFYAVEIPMIHLFRSHYKDMEAAMLFFEVIPADMLASPIKTVYFCLPFMILGAIYFRRYAFVKSLLMFAMLIIAVSLLNHWLVKVCIPADQNSNWIVSGELFESVQILNTAAQQSDKIFLSKQSGEMFSVFLGYCTPFFVWLLSWFRLRETEIA
jgi:hypothetical protein